MKKIFTLIAAVFMMTSVVAKDFTDVMRNGNIYIMRMSDGRTVKMLKR